MKFNIGDWIVDDTEAIFEITSIYESAGTVYGVTWKAGNPKMRNVCGIPVDREDTLRLYSSEKINPRALKPFQRVLVRECKGDTWEADIFSSYHEGTEHPYHCIGAWHSICIPFEGNEYLVGTEKDCLDYWI